MTQEDMSIILQQLPCLQDKCAVDYINALHLGRERINFLEGSNNFTSRLLGALTGKTRRHSMQLADAHQVVNEQSLAQFSLLYEQVELGHRATNIIHSRVVTLQSQVNEIGGHLLDLMAALGALENKVSRDLESLDQRLSNLELQVQADGQLDLVFSELAAGKWHDLPAARRLYLTYEQLYWGSFGLLLSQAHPSLQTSMRERLLNKSIAYLSSTTGMPRDARIERAFWFNSQAPSSSPGSSELLQESIRYLGDWSDSDNSPFTYAAVNSEDLAAEIIQLPFLFNADRLVNAMARDLFDSRRAA